MTQLRNGYIGRIEGFGEPREFSKETEVTMTEERGTELILAAETLIEASGRFKAITGEEQASLAAEYRARVNQQIKDLDAERLDMGAGIRATLEKINARFNTPINALKERLKMVDSALRDYMSAQRALAAAAERARQEQEIIRMSQIEAARQAAEAANLPPPEPEPMPVVAPIEIPKRIEGSYGSKLTSKENWKYRIVDIKKVPEEFLVPPEERVNKSALNAMARSMKDKAKVKGIEFYSEEGFNSRVS